MKKYINIRISIAEDKYDLSYAYLTDYDFTGIEERDNEIVISFEFEKWNPMVRTNLMANLKSIDPDCHIISEDIIGEENWNEEWEKNVKPVILSPAIGITPSWKMDELNTPVKIIINPRMSFGTGEHQTTRLMGKFMEELVKPGQFWIDAGTGTGVLAILAVVLGAEKVFAFDNNIWSVENAKENIKLNNISSSMEIEEASLEEIQLPECDAIAANLFLNILIDSFPKFHLALKRSKGDLIVAGLIDDDEKIAVYKAEQAGFRHITTHIEDEWVAIHFKAEE